jgi:hypothetical protein
MGKAKESGQIDMAEPLSRFTAKVHSSGDYFWLPKEASDELGITGSNFHVGLMIFNDRNETICCNACKTVSGSQVRISDLSISLAPNQEIHGAAFIPHMAIQIWGPVTK